MKHHKSYLDIFGKDRKHLRPHQLMFLLHIALCTGVPRLMNACLREHLKDQIPEDAPPPPGVQSPRGKVVVARRTGKCFHPDSTALMKTFWAQTCDGPATQTTITEAMCMRAAELVSGFETPNIFSLEGDRDYRVFALDSKLADSCIVTDVAHTLQIGTGSESRVLVSPSFLRTVAGRWPTSGQSSVRVYVLALAEALTHHMSLATTLLRIGGTLVAYGDVPVSDEERESRQHIPICDQLISRWKATTTVGFEELTFEALCLHLSCALEDARGFKKTVYKLLRRVVCSNVPDEAAEMAVLVALHGSQELQDAIFDLTDIRSTRSAALPSEGSTSFTRLQRALAHGRHFCFRPSNLAINPKTAWCF
ncbi:Hypothetical protein, putative [Bodo saltans]|uniref:Uncharacterized protein n=1 Tax=Bodo saltans TaxID=75058 RepID=A0A0S4JBK0_BODSA|nr:Hypothetical protein, putative [Bodo saltans]|eukprot:CUG88874.1 Hypothetical protein, putative [Bodo saltans]